MDKLDQEIDELFEQAEKERYVHSRSSETFDDIAGLWFLGEEFEETLSQIARSYIVSSFLLKVLGCMYQRIQKQHNLSDFKAIDLTDSEVVGWFKKELAILPDKEREWLRNELLSVCKTILNGKTQDLDGIACLGNMADASQRCATMYADREDGEVWVYDSIFQLVELITEEA